jgi:hypothetical protein
MQFSIGQAVFFTPKHFTELVIYGKKGVDARSRLLLWDALKRKGLIEQQLKDIMLQALPLDFGEKFSVAAGIVTLVLGIAFIGFATDSIRELLLQIHRITDGPLDYVLLAIQWWLFYIVVSLVSSLLVSIVAFQMYASRIAKHI